MNTESITILIHELELWQRKAIAVAENLEQEAEAAEPIAVVGETRYTLEGWTADSIRHIAEEKDGLPYLLDYLRGLLDLEERQRWILEAARDELNREVTCTIAKGQVSEVLAGTADAKVKRELWALMRALGGEKDLAKVARTLNLTEEDLEQALPHLREQTEKDLQHLTC